ncbi:hypothetical protein BBD41_03260 [Paenibacillus ihbetae]|uniref:Uncharacterized protein n=1 Tax=Paenibacillus ihbetae TaxID=1870820 RepID=A0A1B2DVE1_9BACL|nr:hypothetical protein [Paenibacillus ihbetae]ANY71678.1 hypothetical protein BBD41_03260 [Paenibacillus ihbetae]
MHEPKAQALNATTVALFNNGTITIIEAQQEYEGEQGAVVPAKSIWLNKYHAQLLRDFLNEQFPMEGR